MEGKIRVCPFCKKKIYSHPYLSVKDNKSEICEECSFKERGIKLVKKKN